MDWLTNPTVIAIIAVAATLTATRWPQVSALLKGLLPKTATADDQLPVAASTTADRCEVLRGIRHDISEQDDPEQRGKDLALCDDFRTMLKRLSEPKAAA